MRRFAALTLLIMALLLPSTIAKSSSVISASPPAVPMSRNISTQGDCGGVRSGGGGCILGCCRSIAIGEDCNGNVCTVTAEVCQSGYFNISFEGDC